MYILLVLEYLSNFQFLVITNSAIMKSAAIMNSTVYVCLWYVDTFFWSMYLRVELLQYSMYIHPVLISTNISFYTLQTMIVRILRVPFASHPCQHLVLTAFHFSHLFGECKNTLLWFLFLFPLWPMTLNIFHMFISHLDAIFC